MVSEVLYLRCRVRGAVLRGLVTLQRSRVQGRSTNEILSQNVKVSVWIPKE